MTENLSKKSSRLIPSFIGNVEKMAVPPKACVHTCLGKVAHYHQTRTYGGNRQEIHGSRLLDYQCMRRVEEKPGQNPGRTGRRSPADAASQLGQAGSPSGRQHLQDRQTLHQATWRFTSNERIPIADAMQGPLRWLFRQRLYWKEKKRPLVVSKDHQTKVRSFHTLMLATVVRGRALPLLWESYEEGKLPKSQNYLEERLLRVLRSLVPSWVRVIVVARPWFWTHGVGFVGEGFGPAFREGEIVVSGDARRSCRGIGSGG